jgi:spore maturation protein CgeB
MSIKCSDQNASPLAVTLATEFAVGSTARGILPGLRSSDWMVDEVDFVRFLHPRPRVVGRVEARLRRKEFTAEFANAIVSSVRKHQSRVFLTVKGTAISTKTLDRLRAEGAYLVNYYPDFHFNDVPIETIANYDLVITTKSFQLEPLRRLMPNGEVVFLHHGYSAEIHRPLPSPTGTRDVDILYLGTAAPAKAVALQAIAKAYPAARLRIVGNGWTSFAKGTVLEPSIGQSGAMTGDFYAAEIARAKIVLAIHMGPDRYTGVEDLVSTRTFEIPACGGFMLHVDNPEVRSLFDVPSEIDTFASDAEMIAKIGYWLDHPQEREAVAARGHARAVPAYSYTERGREIARIVEERLARR